MAMQIDKQQIIAKLTELGHQDAAAQADQALPDPVDTDHHAGLLDRLGVNVSDLLGGTCRRDRRQVRPVEAQLSPARETTTGQDHDRTRPRPDKTTTGQDAATSRLPTEEHDMAVKTVEVQADPDTMPVPGQRPGPPFFAVLIVAGDHHLCRTAVGGKYRRPAVPGDHLGDHGGAAAVTAGDSAVALVVGQRSHVAGDLSVDRFDPGFGGVRGGAPG
jgi:hypothetical protein